MQQEVPQARPRPVGVLGDFPTPPGRIESHQQGTGSGCVSRAEPRGPARKLRNPLRPPPGRSEPHALSGVPSVGLSPERFRGGSTEKPNRELFIFLSRRPLTRSSAARPVDRDARREGTETRNTAGDHVSSARLTPGLTLGRKHGLGPSSALSWGVGGGGPPRRRAGERGVGAPVRGNCRANASDDLEGAWRDATTDGSHWSEAGECW